MSLRVGVLDSGIAPEACPQVVGRQVFVASPHGSHAAHGTGIARIIASAAPDCLLLDACIFDASLRTSASVAAAGLDWLVQQQARLVNMSFGLREDREVLRLACERALAAGVILVAASPARGDPVFPAAYPGVIRATGDARCEAGELSALGTSQADFGAHVRVSDASVAGASIGCAHVSAVIATLLLADPCMNIEALRAVLGQRARYHGPERRLC
jgi:hypothetical protein